MFFKHISSFQWMANRIGQSTRDRTAKLFVFLRQHRHELLDEAFQEELASLYRPAERGSLKSAPAMLALALILEAYMGVSDDEVIEATMMDRDCSPYNKIICTWKCSRFILSQ